MATMGVSGLIAGHRTACGMADSNVTVVDYRAIPASSGVFKAEWCDMLPPL